MVKQRTRIDHNDVRGGSGVSTVRLSSFRFLCWTYKLWRACWIWLGRYTAATQSDFGS